MTSSAALAIFTRGIDVSAAQSFDVDWNAVRASGVRFVYVKANTAEGKRDAWFERHARGARAAGLLVGAYHFALVDDDPTDDVEAFLVAIAGVELDLPPMLDIETRNDADALRVLLFVDGWLAHAMRRGQKRPCIYTGPGFWSGLGAMARDARYMVFSLVVAQYGVKQPSALAPWGWLWTIWQSHGNTIAQLKVDWTDPSGKVHKAGDQLWGELAKQALAVPDRAKLLAEGGKCAGVHGEVDRLVFAGTYDDLKRWADLPVAELPTLSDDPRVRTSLADPGHERAGK